MPSSLVSGPLFKFIRVARAVTIEFGAVLRFRENPDAPESTENLRSGELQFANGKLYFNDGSRLVTIDVSEVD